MVYIENTGGYLRCENNIVRDGFEYRCFKKIKTGEYFLENYNPYKRYICKKCIGNFLNRKINNLIDISIKVSKDKPFHIDESIQALVKDKLILLKDESELAKGR
jgi:hypothetical protein